MEELLALKGSSTDDQNKPKAAVSSPNKLGLTIAGVSVGAVLLLYGAVGPFITPALRRYCLPYVPATLKQVQNVMKCLQGRSGRLVDIGSGDGRIVLEAAKHGFTAVGVEINIWLVLYSKCQAWKRGLGKGKATFIRKDMWMYDLSRFENIVIFGTDQLMPALEKKFSEELRSGSVVVACRFPLPNWRPETIYGTGIDRVWMYRIPLK